MVWVAASPQGHFHRRALENWPMLSWSLIPHFSTIYLKYTPKCYVQLHVYIYAYTYMEASNNQGPYCRPQTAGLLLQGHSRDGPPICRNRHTHVYICTYTFCVLSLASLQLSPEQAEEQEFRVNLGSPPEL